MNYIYQILLSGIFIATPASSVSASPTPFDRERELLLGSNETHYFVLRTVFSNPGTHYAFYESLFFEVFDAHNNKKESVLIRKMERKDTTTEGDWVNNELAVAEINLGQTLAKHRVEYALFPVGMAFLVIVGNSLCLKKGDISECFYDVTKKPLNCETCIPRIRDRGFRTRHFIFIGLRFGDPDAEDTPATELFQAINPAVWNEALRKFNERIRQAEEEKKQELTEEPPTR